MSNKTPLGLLHNDMQILVFYALLKGNGHLTIALRNFEISFRGVIPWHNLSAGSPPRLVVVDIESAGTVRLPFRVKSIGSGIECFSLHNPRKFFRVMGDIHRESMVCEVSTHACNTHGYLCYHKCYE